MPSSLLNALLRSNPFTGLVHDFHVGVQVAIGFVKSSPSATQNTIVPTPTFAPTKTIPLFLPPTRCIDIPSSEPTSFPYVAAAMGYAGIVIVLVLYCILRPKSSVDYIPCDPPPSDPAAKLPSTRRRPWTLVLGLTFFFSAVLALLSTDNVSIQFNFGSFIDPSITAIERFLLDGWSLYYSLESHISAHGLRYLKVLLIGIASHCVGIFVVSVLRRTLYKATSLEAVQIIVPPFLVAIAVIASSPWLSWLYWAQFHLRGWTDIRTVHRFIVSVFSRVSRMATSHLLEVSTIVSIGLIYCCASGAIFLYYAFRLVIKRLRLTKSGYFTFRHFYRCCCEAILYQFLLAAITSRLTFYRLHEDDFRRIVWCRILSQQSRRAFKRIFRVHMRSYRLWKTAEIKQCRLLVYSLRAALRSGLETWRTLHIAHKLLIAAPGLILYGYFYIIPAIRKLLLRLRHSVPRR
ncbi:hypothetical protein FB45DRAFT_908330, partial [Roridomyces roridus]